MSKVQLWLNLWGYHHPVPILLVDLHARSQNTGSTAHPNSLRNHWLSGYSVSSCFVEERSVIIWFVALRYIWFLEEALYVLTTMKCIVCCVHGAFASLVHNAQILCCGWHGEKCKHPLTFLNKYVFICCIVCSPFYCRCLTFTTCPLVFGQSCS